MECEDDGYTWVLSVRCFRPARCLLFGLHTPSKNTRPAVDFTSRSVKSVWPIHPTSHDIRSVRSISLPPKGTFTLISSHHRLRRAHCRTYLWGGSTWLKPNTHLDRERGTLKAKIVGCISYIYHNKLCVYFSYSYIIIILKEMGLWANGNRTQYKKWVSIVTKSDL